MEAIFAFLKSCMGDDRLTEDQFILTCQKAKTQIFHNLLGRKFKSEHEQEFHLVIKQQCQRTLDEIAQKSDEPVNLTEAARLYFNRTIAAYLYGKEDSELAEELVLQLSDCMKEFKTYISGNINPVNRIWNYLFPSKLNCIKKNILNVTTKILDLNPDLFSCEEAVHLSVAEKRLFVFTVLFAAQDNTTNLLASELWTLGQDSHFYQQFQEKVKSFDNHKTIYPKGVEQFFARVMMEMTPVPGISRIAKKNLYLSYTLDGKEFHQIIPKGELVIIRMDEMAKSVEISDEDTQAQKIYNRFAAFGGGPQRCPGRLFAELAIKEFVVQFAKRFDISEMSPEKLTSKLQMTLTHEQDVVATLALRSDEPINPCWRSSPI